MKKLLKNISKKDKIIYSSFGILILFILLINFICPSIYSFAMVSILANIALILVIREVMRTLKINFTKLEIMAIIIAILGIYIFYIISLFNRHYLYFADSAKYYSISLTTKEKFARSLIEGIRYLGGSTWSGEYGNFITFFPEFIFAFTKGKIGEYIFSYVLVYIPFLFTAFGVFLKMLMTKLKPVNKQLFFNLSLLLFALFPIVHATAITGQPDFFGLTFIFLIIALTINYDFKKIEYPRLVLLSITTLMALIARRWYLYWVVAYYLCYFIYLLIINFKNKKGLYQTLKHSICYYLISFGSIGLILFPMFKNALLGGVGNYSAFYLMGGFNQELLNQLDYIGYLSLIIMVVGIIYGLKEKNTRLTTILSILNYFLMIILFTRLQNMGLHHVLILVPNYLYWSYLCVTFIVNRYKDFAFRYSLLIIAITTLNFIYGLCSNTNDNFFTKVNLAVSAESNYDQFVEVATWLKENINSENTAYLISHNGKYNPDKFRNIFMPDKTIYNYLPYGSAIIGNHYFPQSLFDAKYVLTVTPFESISIEYKYNDVFNVLVSEGKFHLLETFDMQDAHQILVYERISPVDEHEKSLYLEALKEESKLYPDLYANVINNYVID